MREKIWKMYLVNQTVLQDMTQGRLPDVSHTRTHLLNKHKSGKAILYVCVHISACVYKNKKTLKRESQ